MTHTQRLTSPIRTLPTLPDSFPCAHIKPIVTDKTWQSKIFHICIYGNRPRPNFRARFTTIMLKCGIALQFGEFSFNLAAIRKG